MKKPVVLMGLLLGLIFFLLAAKPLVSPGRQLTEKKHTNNKYNHQFSYPMDWQVEEWDIEQAANLKSVPDGSILHQGRFFGKTGHFEIIIWENKSKTPVRTWLTWFRHEDLILKDVPQKENFIVADILAIRYLQKKTSRKKPILYIFFNKDGKIFELTQEREDLINVEASSSSQLINPIYDKIIQSFRFVTPTPTTLPEYPR